MAKFIKAYCNKSNQYVAIELRQNKGVWEAVNMIGVTKQQAEVMSSEVKQTTFKTAKNLIACNKCGNRVISGCSCNKSLFGCKSSKGYDFQCIYCNNLKIDYSEPIVSGSYKEGDIVRLSQGQEIKIRMPNGGKLSRIEVGVGWDPVIYGEQMDLDSSVVVAGNGAKELIYFRNLVHPNGCVIHHGDNLTGESNGGNDDENITTYLDKVPKNRDRLIFVLNIYNCEDRHQKLSDVKNMYIRLYDPVKGKGLIEFKATANYANNTAIIIGMAYRRGTDWYFKAVGKGSNAKTVDDLAEEAIKIPY